VVLAIKPAKDGASCLTNLNESVDLVNASGFTNVGLAIDLWTFSEELLSLENVRPVIERTKVVSVADRMSNISLEHERLPPGAGELPLLPLLRLLVESGYRGDIEFDPIGETVAAMGYEHLLASVRQYVDQLQVEMSLVEINSCRSESGTALAEAFLP
jgi:sugar phosphate isomerase/epimerase